ncbi:MAG TPA: hypothetical protein ACFCUC_07265 [Desulfobacterales bacterium]
MQKQVQACHWIAGTVIGLKAPFCRHLHAARVEFSGFLYYKSVSFTR